MVKKVRGVAILLDERTTNCVTSIVKCNDRVLMVKLKTKPVDVVVIQVYMPTSGHDEEEVDEVYDIIDEVMAAQKKRDYCIIMGDFNAVVGE